MLLTIYRKNICNNLYISHKVSIIHTHLFSLLKADTCIGRFGVPYFLKKMTGDILVGCLIFSESVFAVDIICLFYNFLHGNTL